ncbi:hypothetical protein TNCV_687221 [Trichonephila clavipes]|nr:hypothetical protein TNCV_687221 [Trichonephila clavipes]
MPDQWEAAIDDWCEYWARTHDIPVTIPLLTRLHSQTGFQSYKIHELFLRECDYCLSFSTNGSRRRIGYLTSDRAAIRDRVWLTHELRFRVGNWSLKVTSTALRTRSRHASPTFYWLEIPSTESPIGCFRSLGRNGDPVR